LLYRAQCAWGAADENSPTTSPAEQIDHIQAFIEDCASILKRRTRESPELRTFFHEIEEQVNEKIAPSKAELRQLLDHAREWSGGNALWAQLRLRLQESFAELVLSPALIEVLRAHDELTSALRGVSQIRKNTSQEQLQKEIARLQGVRKALKSDVSTIQGDFSARLTDAATKLKSGDQAARQQLTKTLGKGFEPLLAAVDAIKSDLTKKLISPMREALKTNREVFNLEDELRDLIGDKANELARAYSALGRRIHITPPRPSRADGTLSWKVREDDTKNVAQISEVERDALRLYECMRGALTSRAEFLLQAQSSSLHGTLAGLVRLQTSNILNACQNRLPSFPLERAIESVGQTQVSVPPPKLPQTFFPEKKATTAGRKKEQVVIGTREEKQIVEAPWWKFWKKSEVITVKVPEFGLVNYKTLNLPDEDGMGRDWAAIVEERQAALWDVLCEWMLNALRQSSETLSSSIYAILDLAERQLKEQQELAERDHQAVIDLWQRIDLNLDDLVSLHNQLRQATISEHRL
jgi:hypothetical protein